MGANEVWVFGETGAGGEGWYACGIDGIAGTGAKLVRVVDDDGDVVSMPIECRFGAFVVGLDGSRPAVIEVLSGDGSVLEEVRFSGHDWATQ